MAIDILQQKIRKLGNSLMVDFSIFPDELPAPLVASCNGEAEAYGAFCRSLLTGLKGVVPAVRFRFLLFSLYGEKGMELLRDITSYASSLGFYVLLDMPGVQSVKEAEFAARKIWEDEMLTCNGVLISGYNGSDIVKPFLPFCEEKKKDLFVIARSPNKSASELQDLLAGSRTVHMAAADYVNRYGVNTVGKYGYSRVGVLISATVGDSIRMVRAKYPKLFMITDGLDTPGANAKNCASGFDKLGHGSLICVGSSVTGAWKEKQDSDEIDYGACALEEIQKINKRVSRYVTIL